MRKALKAWTRARKCFLHRHDRKIDGLLLGLVLASRPRGSISGTNEVLGGAGGCSNLVRRELCVLWSPGQAVGAGVEVE